MISSAQVLRDMEHQFNPSELFAPALAAEKARIARENHNQRQRRRNKGNKVKIGHGGTLDPLATGVLITGIGKGTKALSNFLLCTKTYEAVILFGTSTDSYDRVGKVLRRAPYEHITRDMVETALGQFRGKFLQLPPLFSALKMNGKPLYEYAREGKEPPKEIQRREVEVLELELLEWMEGGTHEHVAPTDEAGHAEINVAQKVWKQENAMPAQRAEANLPSKNDDPLADFESKKRKLSESQDDLVTERPASKRRPTIDPQETVMSGGLAPPSPTTTSAIESEVVDERLQVDGEVQPDAALQSNTSAQADPTPQSNTESPLTSTQPTPTKGPGPPAAKLRMTVTSGFYVRSLCHDLGTAVNSAALMAELERTRQGEFEIGGANVLEYSDLVKGEEVWGKKVEGMLDDWEAKHGWESVRGEGTRAKLEEDDVKRERGDDTMEGHTKEDLSPSPNAKVKSEDQPQLKKVVKVEEGKVVENGEGSTYISANVDDSGPMKQELKQEGTS